MYIVDHIIVYNFMTVIVLYFEYTCSTDGVSSLEVLLPCPPDTAT